MIRKIVCIVYYLVIYLVGCNDDYQKLQNVNYNQNYALAQDNNYPCEQGACYTATGNLLVGRENQLRATSTCGLYEPQRYCIVSHLEDRKSCFRCDSREQNHNISNIIYQFLPGTRQKSWWQSENGKERVSIQLDLKSEFHFTHLIIVFKTFRPAAMLIERSYDNGKTYKVYQYFASDCAKSFPHAYEGLPRNLTDVVCESKYSSVAPSSDGEVIFRVLANRGHIENPYAKEVQDLLRITNLRINFTKLHTLGDDLLDNRQEIQEKYYYAISHMVVRGSCFCYGHAITCLPVSNDILHHPDMVHGRCKCIHHTTGEHCNQCEPLFNDLKWQPAIGKQKNICKMCRCHNHATKCNFDQNVYEQSGRISGGVCDNCEHHTKGIHCDQCEDFYYKDPNRSLDDPNVCLPCDCDRRGTIDDAALCDSSTDLLQHTEAGKCHCKKNVDGRRCDQCKIGFWNYSSNHSDGCEPCHCDVLGTIDNQGCNVNTGECICKLYVIGRDCDTCLPEFWGLSEKEKLNGCQPCDCDPGGSFDNNCDPITGQCKCRDFVQGRTCNIVNQQYFVASLDFYLYEAEDANLSPQSQVVIRESYRDGRNNTWTGSGFVRNYDQSYIEFIVDNIKSPIQYTIVFRYEPQIVNDGWQDANLKIIPLNQQFLNDEICNNSVMTESSIPLRFTQSSRHLVVYPSICLRPNTVYKIRVDFFQNQFVNSNQNQNQIEMEMENKLKVSSSELPLTHSYLPSSFSSNSNSNSNSNSILIDSMILIPNVEQIPFFQGSQVAEQRYDQFKRYRCVEYFYQVHHNFDEMPEICKQYVNSISFYIYNGAYACQCDPTGSVSKFCSEFGGVCVCKTNVIGRKCNQCAPGTYDFSPEGCRSCDCNHIGALNNYCDSITGQCMCRNNTYGRECNECEPGFWNFPNCQRCDCNGHADRCDSKTGDCIDCRDFTEGLHCDRCSDGYYGDPRFGVGIMCRPCPCPEIKNSDNSHSLSFADRCTLDPITNDVICECQLGYAGLRCDVCADNYYGNLSAINAHSENNGVTLCQPCDCNQNIDLAKPANCNQVTGKCLQCLFNTEGDHCELCKSGYYRLYNKFENVENDENDVDEDINSINNNYYVCTECSCDLLGTNRTAGTCDQTTGQCECLANVTGTRCDSCLENHWKIASGQGCEQCNCDPKGSLNLQCNLFDGQCTCRPGFGGERCSECQSFYWGDPNSQCYPCDCNPDGALSMQCSRQDGSCICVPGIGGQQCDRCDIGYLGEAPFCSPCGECFDHWHHQLNEFESKTASLIDQAKQIQLIGATGAYTKQFEDIENDLGLISRLLSNKTLHRNDMEFIGRLSSESHQKLNRSNDYINQIENHLANSSQHLLVAQIQLDDLKTKTNLLKNQTNEYRKSATLLKETIITGALSLTNTFGNQATLYAHEANKTQDLVADTYKWIKRTESLFNRNGLEFEETNDKIENYFDRTKNQLALLNDRLPTLNEKVCDKKGNPCDEYCGGAGCEFCGGISCDNGMLILSTKSYDLAMKSYDLLQEKENSIDSLIRNISQIKLNTTSAFNAAKQANIKSNETEYIFNNLLNERNAILENIRQFLNASQAKPEDIRSLTNEVLKKDIHLRPEKISELSKQIQSTVNSLTGIESILNETTPDLQKALYLKNEASNKQKIAVQILEKANKIIDKLVEADNIKNMAKIEIERAKNSITNVENNFDEIKKETNFAQDKIKSSISHVDLLKQKLKAIQQNNLKNDLDINEIEKKIDEVNDQSLLSKNKATNLKNKYNLVNRNILEKSEQSISLRERAKDLLKRASTLTTETNNKLKIVNEIQRGNSFHLNNIDNLSKKIVEFNDQMKYYLDLITRKSEYYRHC